MCGINLPSIYIHSPPAVRQIIRETLENARRQVLSRFPRLKSLILYGSFSTGDFRISGNSREGWHFISDIDLIAVVSTSRFFKERLAAPKRHWRLSNGATIDLCFETEDTLYRAPNILDYRNLFNGGVILFGKNILTKQPPSFAQSLSSGQGLRLLCNRLWGIIEGNVQDVGSDASLHRLYKGLLACYQAELIMKNEYETFPELVLKRLKRSIETEKRPTKNLLFRADLFARLEANLFGCNRETTAGTCNKLMPTVVHLIYHQIEKLLRHSGTIEIVDWKSDLCILPKIKWPTGPFWGNWLSLIFRGIFQHKHLPCPSLLSPIRKPVCIRLWTGWLAMGLALLHPDKEKSFIEIYNKVMGWFPGFEKAETLKHAVAENPYWQRIIPVTSRI